MIYGPPRKQQFCDNRFRSNYAERYLWEIWNSGNLHFCIEEENIVLRDKKVRKSIQQGHSVVEYSTIVFITQPCSNVPRVPCFRWETDTLNAIKNVLTRLPRQCWHSNLNTKDKLFILQLELCSRISWTLLSVGKPAQIFWT